MAMKLCNASDIPPLWKETHYNESFIQIELGEGPGSTNSYICLGQDASSQEGICQRGTELKLVPCYERDNRLNLFNWVDGRIKATGCGPEKDLCVDYDGQGLVLESCIRASKIAREG